MLDTSGKNTALIVVTGFGPFGEITTNSSSVAVEELKALWNANVELAQSSLRLSTVTQIPVTYKAVGKVVDEIWNENPTLVIHVGVDQSASAITLEQQAFNHSYSMPDACGLLCDRAGFCLSEGCDSLFCGLDLSRTVDHLNELGFKAQLSSFPGLYLCGYIYYRSLSKHHEKVAFVHVPPIGTSFSAQYLARALFEIILDLAQQRGVTVPMIQFNSEI
ncbi:Pyroglutamyl-peptidase I [Fasciola gigantica]|uniref:Pyroglutamyl-peptidase I n=1 Tax=Fasciola gigantica TaxID=46835 RepID=A0A504Y6W4_FASGI|nr:Pyroglutamyl-peptidase I [Fasciola gigantica]